MDHKEKNKIIVVGRNAITRRFSIQQIKQKKKNNCHFLLFFRVVIPLRFSTARLKLLTENSDMETETNLLCQLGGR